MTYSVTLPDGTIGTRNSKRTYTHAVASKVAEGSWYVTGWCGSRDLAEKRVRAEQGQDAKWKCPTTEYVIIEATA